jgi:FAD/FMN-containing dehydrogenase
MLDKSNLKKLRTIVGKTHVLTEPEDLVAYSYDGTFTEQRPDLVVRPDSTSQVSEIMQ